MLKKRTHQLWIVADALQLLMHAFLQFFAFPQRSSGYASSLGMTPHQLIRVQVRRISRQEMQGQTPLRAGHIFLDHLFLMRRESALIGGKPECTFGIGRRGRADALALPKPVDHGRAATFSPSLAMHRVDAKAGFVPEINFGTFRFALRGNSWKGVTPPAFNRSRIALVGTLQRLLSRQIEFGQAGCPPRSRSN